MDKMKWDSLEDTLKSLGATDDEITYFLAESGFTDMTDLLLVKEEQKLKELGLRTFKLRMSLLGLIDQMRRETEGQNAAMLNLEQEGGVLAEIVEDEVWLDAVICKRDLQFGPMTYTAGIKGVIAANLGVYSAVNTLCKKVREFCLENGLPSPDFYHDLKKMIAQRKSEVFSFLDQNYVNGVSVCATAEEMTELIERSREILVPGIMKVANAADAWHTNLTEQMASELVVNLRNDPNFSCEGYADPSPVFDAARELKLCVNKTFACDGIQVATALYTEYKNFSKILNDENLAKYTGLVDRDAVLTYLGFNNVGASTVRSEKNIMKFVLSILDIENLAAGDKEARFLMHVQSLLKQIDWSILTGDPADRGRFTRHSPASGVGMPNSVLIAAAQQDALETPTDGLTTIGGATVPMIGDH